jgi:hypothetical protein
LQPDDVEVAGFGRSQGFGPREVGDCVRILSIDSGGVRGLIPALILARIERETGKPISQHFDLIVGTSTGAILALGLTRPSDSDAAVPAFSADKIAQLFREDASTIFPNSNSLFRTLKQVVRPKYEAENIEAVFERYFSDVRIWEALTNVRVPAYDIEEGRRIWFSRGTHADLYMRDIVRGATAVPTYLPPVDRSRVGPRQVCRALLQVAQRQGAQHSVPVYRWPRLLAPLPVLAGGRRLPSRKVVGEPGLDAGVLLHGRPIAALQRDAGAVRAQECLVGTAGHDAKEEEAASQSQTCTDGIPCPHCPLPPQVRSQPSATMPAHP